MKITRKIFVVVTLAMLVFSLVAVSSKPSKAVIHIQTLGYEGRDVVKLNVEITGEDSDSFYIVVNPGTMNKIRKEINIEKLPVVQINATTYKVPKAYLTEIAPNEYVAVVPNDVTKMKWTIRDQIKGMDGTDTVEVLVKLKEGGTKSILNKYGAVYLEFLGGLGAALEIRVSDIKALSEEAEVEFVEANGTVHICLSDSIPLINADDVWALGYDGTGITICVIDTGIDDGHCDFPGSYPTGKIVAWKDYVNNRTTPYDDHGHGTHCASIAAGAASPKGVAPGASLMICKAINSAGSGDWTDVIAGICWAEDHGADIISMSLGVPGGDGTSSVAQQADWAVDRGICVVVAAGNYGSACKTICTPGDARKVITVGASDKSDALASFSSRGPTTDGRVKPDITAPGVSIYAANNGTTCSDVSMDGTSMATPHIAGVAALMLQARPSATPLQVKNCMGKTAIDKNVAGRDCHWGWGRVDALAAVNQIKSNPNVTPPGDDCNCDCLGTILISALVLLGIAIKQK